MPQCQFCRESYPAGSSRCPVCGQAVVHAEELSASVRDLLQQGRKLEAVKLYQDRTGISLMEAKAAVEALENSEPDTALPGASADFPEELQPRVLEMLREGQKLKAVKLYRDTQGVALLEAKRAVEALAERHGMSASSTGCLGSLLALLLLGLSVAGLLTVSI